MKRLRKYKKKVLKKLHPENKNKKQKKNLKERKLGRAKLKVERNKRIKFLITVTVIKLKRFIYVSTNRFLAIEIERKVQF